MHKKMKTLGVSLLSTVVLMATPNIVSAEEADVLAEEVTDDFSLTIFHTNDMHASINNFGKMSYFLNEQRALLENTLYFDAGDAFSGNPVVDLMDGIPMIELLNQMELDLFTVGNHEFDYGQEAFQARRNESNFPWLSANLDASGSATISQTDAYKIFEFKEDNVKVGVIGLTQAPPATAPSGLVGLIFNPYYETVQKYAHLRDEVDILIGLNHIGQADDTRLAEQTEMFDLIIGGHSHSAIDKPIVINGTPIAQSGSNGRNVGILDLTLDQVTKEVSVEGKLQSVRDLDDNNLDPIVQGMLDQYKKETDEKLSKVIGKTNTGLSRDNRRQEDSALGNMITDALRHATGADIAITNNGGIRASIEPGDITLRDIFTVDPFGNIVSTVEMKGHDLKEMIAYSFHRSLADYGPQIDLQSSGLHYIIYTDKAGLYVDSDLFINGAPMDLDKSYTITTNNFMVDGGDGYDFSKATILGQNQMQVTEALINYIEDQKILDYEITEGRILEKYYVEHSEGIRLDLNKGEDALPIAETLIANFADLPEGTTVQYVNAESIDLTGKTTGEQLVEVLVTYPNNSTDVFTIPVSVVALIEKEDDSKKDEVVVVPNDEVKDETDKTSDKDTDKTNDKDTDKKIDKKTDKKTEDEKLPKTGEAVNSFKSMGIVAILVGSTLFIGTNRKKEEVN